MVLTPPRAALKGNLPSPCAMNSLHSYPKKNNEKKRKLLLIGQ
jgi:hypothetical protein